MEIPQKLMTKWNALRTPGDATKIVDLAKERGLDYSDESVNRAFRTGKCNEDIFKTIADFYEARAALIKGYL